MHYFISKEKDKKAHISSEYSTLYGPNEFTCTLTELEYRNWNDDLKIIVDELNRLYAENLELKSRKLCNCVN